MQALNVQLAVNEAAGRQVQSAEHEKHRAEQGESIFDKLLEQELESGETALKETLTALKAENTTFLDSEQKSARNNFSTFSLTDEATLLNDDVKTDAKNEPVFVKADIPKDAEIMNKLLEAQKNGSQEVVESSDFFEKNAQVGIKKRKISEPEELAANHDFFKNVVSGQNQSSAEANAPLVSQGAGMRKMGEKSVLNEIPAITVDDRRTSAVQKQSGLASAVVIDKNGEARMDVSFAQGQAPQTDIDTDGIPVKNVQNFSNLLSQEIQNNAQEFVKTGSIILRDNNAGTINMVLHPEELGNVKIHLELSDKVITGKITVETLEAFNAFKANLHTLRVAFNESGFSGAGFELNWSGANSGGGQGGENGRNGSEKNPNGRLYSDALPHVISEADERVGDYTFSAVNVFI